MANRQYFTLKFNSSFLKEKKYNLHMGFEDALLANKVIALADNQILRLIRKVTGREVALDVIEGWYEERDFLKRQKNSKENREKIRELQTLIYDFMFIPEYVTIVMEEKNHYDILFHEGLYLNGKKYVRTSCSASQGRVSTVVFVEDKVSVKVLVRLDNGRDLSKKLVPSKYNAYLGTSGSATKTVSTPRVCVIPDCLETRVVKVDWVTEVADKSKDDLIVEREVPIEFNLFDGNGLISPYKAQEWAEELGLEHLPAQWCIRANFTKGMLSVFDFVDFCKEKNNENYNVRTLYGQIVDLREIDVILTESQFKLWDSFESYEQYEQNCIKNGLTWGVSLYTPEFDKDILELNYQFLQTLKLTDSDIHELCKMTVEYFEGISSDNIYYTILFLLGGGIEPEKIDRYLKSSNNHWVTALMLNHDLINDDYIRNKIYDLMVAKIKDSFIGRIMIDGNFQVIVPDSYAFMQHACGLEVKGLLNRGEFYSNYWNGKGVKIVDGMRSPLTHVSEHNLLNIVTDEEKEKWFKYYYTGLIANCKDEHTLRFAGSDYDYDIIATTSNPIIIGGTYKNQLPIVYQAPKATKINVTPEEMFKADIFTFGSIIGSITNKTTNMYALLPYFKEGSVEYNILMNRLKMGCKLQSAQIDKAKIGKAVKGIPTCWVKYSKPKEEDSPEWVEEQELNNTLLCDKHPYFFIYLYRDTHKKYRKYYDGYNKSCKITFGLDLDQLFALKKKSVQQLEFIENYHKYLPVNDSPCEMNRICHYMESIDFNIKKKLKKDKTKKPYLSFFAKDTEVDPLIQSEITRIIRQLHKDMKAQNDDHNTNRFEFERSRKDIKDNLVRYAKKELLNITSNKNELTSGLIRVFYEDFPSYNKNVLFQICGRNIVENVRSNVGNRVYVPVPDNDGEIKFLNKRYKVEMVELT